MQLVSKRLVRDNMGFGKHTGGMGYEMIVASEGTPLWGFMTVTSGAKFSSVYGMFGGYGCGTYPLARVKGVNVYDVLRTDPSRFDLSIEKIMNDQPFEGGQYMTSHMGLQFDIAKDGELYMMSQGAGGGYGDALERDPHAVVRDVELNRISAKVAREIFAVAYDPTSFVLDVEGTNELRAQARKARLERGKPYAEFVKEFVTPEPPKDLLYYGSWGDDTDELTATVFDIDGPKRVTAPVSQMPIIMLPDRRDLKVAELEARVRELEEKHGENVQRKS
jgi:acetone carboxylase, alpha subunit